MTAGAGASGEQNGKCYREQSLEAHFTIAPETGCGSSARRRLASVFEYRQKPSRSSPAGFRQGYRRYSPVPA
jgi:hypothetical protein